MKTGFYAKLAVGNMKKNGKTYIPYLLTCIITVAMSYMVISLSRNPGLAEMAGGDTLSLSLHLACWITALFALIFLFYTNSFLMKRRKKEFGIFQVLGMEKRHLSRVVWWETVYVAACSLTAGLILGIALDKVMFLLITRGIGGEIPLGFFLSGTAVWETVVLFASIFLIVFLHGVCQIHRAGPIDMLRDSQAGEREPKTKWVMVILGLACLGAGYYIAVTTTNPLASLLMFFVAVLLVIAGTYLLFTAGSIAFLKTLRKRKSYYYKTRHFIGVSGMIYRMKQNAVGLANICILSTAVLVMVSSTTSLMLGIEDILNVRYPTDLAVYASKCPGGDTGEMPEAVRQLQQEKGISVRGEIQYTYLMFSAICQGDTYHVDRSAPLSSVDSIHILMFIPLDDYNQASGEHETLEEGEILLYSNRTSFDEPVLKLFDRTYTVAKKLDRFIGNGLLAANMSSCQFIVVPDMEELYELNTLQKQALTDIASDIRTFYGFDTDAGEEEQTEFYRDLCSLFAADGYQATVESKADDRAGFMGLYGGIFFLGVFLGVLFLMATVLIIYYKQISEGYDDKERFAVLQKVGMRPEEIRASIRSQVWTVFFLPLLTAGIHLCAAFPMISRLLALMNLTNTWLYVGCTLVCYLIFAAGYLFIYLLTAKTYYRIVSK